MKILFTITGIGLGHATRDFAIIKKLDADVRIGTYLTAYDFFKDKYKTFKIPYIKFPENSFSVSIWKILFYNLFTPLNLCRTQLRLKKEIKEFKPDLIITDSELATIYSAKNIPVIAIHNHNLEKIKKINGNMNLKLQAKFLYKLVEYGNEKCSKIIIPELIGKKKNGRINYINPIINEEGGIIKNNSILIMLGGSRFTYPFIEKLIPFLKTLNEKFIIFGYKDFKEGNIISYKFNPDFIKYLKGCKGLITFAGYSALSESLYYKKPALVFSIPGHIEQYINAESVSKIFMTDIDTKNPEDSILKFLKNIPEQREKLKKLKVKNGVDEAVRIIKNEVAKD